MMRVELVLNIVSSSGKGTISNNLMGVSAEREVLLLNMFCHVANNCIIKR